MNNQKLGKKFTNWEEIIKDNNCFFCQKNFTEKDIREKNYQLTYATVYGVVEVYHIYHLPHREHYPNGIACDICQKPIANLIILDEVKRTYHPECLEKDKYYSFHTHPKILKVVIQPKYKITVLLDDGREITKTFELFKQLGYQEKELEEYELYEEYIYFPQAEQRISFQEFTNENCGCC